MKKLLLLLAMVGMIFTACTPGGGLDNDNNVDNTEQPGGSGSGGGNATDPNNPLNNKKCASNEILYISKSCLPMELNNYDGWGAKLISNTYENGVGRLTFNGEVTTIPKNAFSGNDLLEFIKMPKSVTSIGESTFSGCTSLTSITIPNSVTSIGNRAFEGCTGELIIDSNALGLYGGKFTKLTIGDSVTSIGGSAFSGCDSLTSVIIGNNVTSIGMYAFYNCTSLTSITIPDSVTSIEDDAFEGCSSLISVYYKGGLSAWCKMSFNDAYANPLNNGTKLYLKGVEVTNITIPSDITEIKDYTFYGCTSLKEVYCKPATPPTGGSSMFSYYNGDYRPIGCKIYVPRNSVDVYKSASYWRNHADYIEGYDF